MTKTTSNLEHGAAALAVNGEYPMPILLTDTREKKPLLFKHLQTTTSLLQTGDYSVKGYETDFAVERKTIPDLLHSLTHARGRFERELQRLVGIGSRGFCRLLIVGGKSELLEELTKRKTTQAAVIGSLAAIDSDGVPVVWRPTPEAAAEWVESCAVYFFNRKRKQQGLPYKAPEWARSAAWNAIP